MLRRITTLLVAVSFGLFLPTTAPAQAEIEAIVQRSTEAMGGAEALEKTRLLRFDFAVSRGGEELVRYRHWWDRWTGDYRLEGTTGDGEEYLVLFNVNSRDGQAWRSSQPLAGDEANQFLERAYGRYINDSYWFLMPWKWQDPGVQLTLHDPEELDDQTFDVVELSFVDGTGLTSGDHYWGWISRDSGLMERWQYVLQNDDGSPGSSEYTTFAWTDWIATQSGIKLSKIKTKQNDENELAIFFPVLEARTDVSDEELTSIFKSH